MFMKRYDVVVIGAGDVGLAVAFKAAAEELKVALIDKARVGGTCVNNGCVPSKTLIHVADRVLEINASARLGINATISSLDFRSVMDRTRTVVANGTDGIKQAIESTENIDLYSGTASFIDERVISVGKEKIRGRKIFIASGSRPSIPPIPGLDAVPYLTNETLLQLEEKPESLIMIGGGYIGLEYAHFFSAVGTKVTVIERSARLLSFEEPEISELLKSELSRRMDLRMVTGILGVKGSAGGCTVTVKDTATGQETELSAEKLMVATGRKSNADILNVANAGIETGPGNFITVNDQLETNRKHIWAIGDAIGRSMFTHAGDKMAEIAWHNATHKKKMRMDYRSVPHAVFVQPQIASVGLTEEKARKEYDVLVGKAMYSDTVMGEAMREKLGFAKAIVEKNTKKILGFHIIGPHASILIQEVVNAVAAGGDVSSITGSMHTFPALSDLIP
ncbi:MAG: dihydrolipoyl dehydrogenase, partial [Nitrospirae bacterium]|nr:dihydrolipoyl dehydrogenase [Nitrospirota bacterium]